MNKQVAILTMSGSHHSIIVTGPLPSAPNYAAGTKIGKSFGKYFFGDKIFFPRLTLMNRTTKLLATPLGILGFGTRRSYSLVLSEVIAAEQSADIGFIGRIVAHLNFGGLHNG